MKAMDRWFAVVMAGGRGERFWPLSLKTPKPFMRLFRGRSLLRMTFERLSRLLPPSHVLIAITEELADRTKTELPELPPENLIVEPEGKDTAACIGYSTLWVMLRREDAVVACLPADHFVSEEESFTESLRFSFRLAESVERIVTIGLKPRRPETAYGYIKAARLFDPSRHAYEVERFVEKPSLDKAIQFLEEGCYFWNSGIFVFRGDVLLRELREYMPELAFGLEGIRDCLVHGVSERLKALYRGLPRISIDYGLMEKTKGILMVEGTFSWDDVGSWASLFRFLDKDEDGNFKDGPVHTIDTRNSLLLALGVRTCVVGLSDVAVVASQDGVIVCPLDRAQDVKGVVRGLEEGS